MTHALGGHILLTPTFSQADATDSCASKNATWHLLSRARCIPGPCSLQFWQAPRASRSILERTSSMHACIPGGAPFALEFGLQLPTRESAPIVVHFRARREVREDIDLLDDAADRAGIFEVADGVLEERVFFNGEGWRHQTRSTHPKAARGDQRPLHGCPKVPAFRRAQTFARVRVQGERHEVFDASHEGINRACVCEVLPRMRHPRIVLDAALFDCQIGGRHGFLTERVCSASSL